jgi:hypothetical protein
VHVDFIVGFFALLASSCTDGVADMLKGDDDDVMVVPTACLVCVSVYFFLFFHRSILVFNCFP